ncbi:unnamed protein product [Discosporangium mesarthrocarpum]
MLCCLPLTPLTVVLCTRTQILAQPHKTSQTCATLVQFFFPLHRTPSACVGARCSSLATGPVASSLRTPPAHTHMPSSFEQCAQPRYTITSEVLASYTHFTTKSQSQVTEDALRSHCPYILLECIMPNGVWRAGVVASTVRKVAMVTLYTALREGKVGVPTLYATAEQMLPVLQTNLEDYDASTRQMTCLSLQLILSMIP